MNCLLAGYATSNKTAEADAEITNFQQSEHTLAARYLEALWEKSLRCGLVYEETRLEAVFI